MKRTAIILLSILVAFMATNVAEAKSKKRTSKSSIPSASVFWNTLGNRDLSTIGLKLLYEKKEDNCGLVYYGTNVKVASRGGWDVNITATGPHAFYYTNAWEVESSHDFGFKNKADRDKFYNEMMKIGYDSDTFYKSHSNGWYLILQD